MRQFGPLVSVLATVALIAAIVLPSALNLPNSNPATVLEYAPIPPEDNQNPPPNTSGFESLGIASSNSLTTAAPPEEELKKITDAKTRRQRSKKCVGKRQTEDPNAPDCQNYFEGDNGGATSQGVTRDEVTVVIYNNAVTTTDGQRTESSPRGGVVCDVELMDCDLDGKQDPDPHVWIRVANAYSRYFNARYQTYNRNVKVWYYWSQANNATGRRGDAEDIFKKFKPFAVIDHAWTGGFHEDFTDAMANRNTMVFTSLSGQAKERDYFKSYAPLVWSYWPDIENWADLFVGYVCEKVAGTKVTSGDFVGQDRRYGFYSTADAGFEGLQAFYELAAAGMKQRCGVQPISGKADLKFPFAGWAVDSAGDQSYGATNVATWIQEDVNTIIWFGGAETKTSAAADAQDYDPEWFVAGDGLMDANSYAQLQGQDTWNNAWTMSYQIAQGRRQESPAYAAYKESEPEGLDDNWAESDYRPFFLLFTAIQVAGPKLTPRQVDIGMHSVIRKKSTSPFVAACYYFPGDYTCVKDANEQWYDKTGVAPDTSQGCWRLVNKGTRYARDEWGQSRAAGGMGHATPRSPERDPCSGYSSPTGIRPGTPSGPGR